MLLVLSGLFVAHLGVGFLRLQDFFLRMHPPALAYTFGSWCVTLACDPLLLDARVAQLVLHPWLIVIMLASRCP